MTGVFEEIIKGVINVIIAVIDENDDEMSE